MAMNVKELSNVIQQIEGVYADAGVSRAAADLGELLTLFEGHEDMPVDEFLEEFRKLYVKQPRKTAAKKPTAPVDEVLVSRYVRRLKEAGKERAPFDQVFAELSADKKARKDEINQIQHLYIGGRKAWGTRKAALDAISETFNYNRYQSAVLEDIKKVTPW